MIVADNEDVLIERHPTPRHHTLSLLPDIYVEAGTKADWDLLHELHYKAESLPIGPRFYRCVLHGQTIGVGVMSITTMLSAGRNEVFTHLRPNVGGKDSRVMNQHRANWMNEFACCNSRLVLDTMFRGAGIAYRMQNLMMRLTGKRVIEFQSSMSKFNPFAAKAGIRFTKPKKAAKYGAGLAFFRRWFDCVPSDYVGVMQELEAMPTAVREKCVAEMRAFYYANSSREKSGNQRFDARERVAAMELGRLLKQLQQLVFASPLYGTYENPDYDLQNGARALPPRLPLLAFDNQPVDAPLDLTKIV